MGHGKSGLPLRPQSRPTPSNNVFKSQKDDFGDDEQQVGSLVEPLPSPNRFAIAGVGDPFTTLPVDLPQRVIAERVDDCKCNLSFPESQFLT
jgi:hypothetical protein